VKFGFSVSGVSPNQARRHSVMAGTDEPGSGTGGFRPSSTYKP
jgi:hypothetical protein